MGKCLSDAAIQQYREQGYYFPVPVLSAQDVAEHRAHMQAVEAREGDVWMGRFKEKPHLLFTWLDALVRHPRILDAVEDLIGPDILVWGAGYFNKAPQSKTFISWHQDATYWGIGTEDIVTAWVALSDVTPESGCMRFLPGSHLAQVEHTPTFAADNLLSRGQELAVKVDENQAVDIVLKPGEISLHHVLIQHASGPNRTATPRIGFAIRYISPRVVPHDSMYDTATLVRGRYDAGHFKMTVPPRQDLDSDNLALYQHVQQLNRKKIEETRRGM